MPILADSGTKVIVQGITGKEGSFHTRSMLAYGTKVVAGVTPGKGGTRFEGVPVYNSMRDAVRDHRDADTSVIFVPAKFASDALYEATEAGMRKVVVITEHIPLHDELRAVNFARANGVRVVGPNCPGVISPSQRAKVGIIPASVASPGKVGIVSRSGTLTYEIANHLSKTGLGVSTAVGIGGDPIIGMSFADVLGMFRDDSETKGVVIIGEIGGSMEEDAAAFIRSGGLGKPAVAYIAGRTAPPGKRMGHAGAIISMGVGTADSKIKAFESASVPVADRPSQVAELMKAALQRS
ncbi:MAG: succinate--CoA ligase subunit alpha [Nitrososphaeria archaeon]